MNLKYLTAFPIVQVSQKIYLWLRWENEHRVWRWFTFDGNISVILTSLFDLVSNCAFGFARTVAVFQILLFTFTRMVSLSLSLSLSLSHTHTHTHWMFLCGLLAPVKIIQSNASRNLTQNFLFMILIYLKISFTILQVMHISSSFWIKKILGNYKTTEYISLFLNEMNFFLSDTIFNWQPA